MGGLLQGCGNDKILEIETKNIQKVRKKKMSNIQPFQCKYDDIQTRDKLIDTAIKYGCVGPDDKTCWGGCRWFVINDNSKQGVFNGYPYYNGYKECSVDEMLTILKNKGADDMKKKDFQVCVANITVRDNILDIAEEHGWDVAPRQYWSDDCVWIVEYPQNNEIHGNKSKWSCVEETYTIEQALDIIRSKNCVVSSEPEVHASEVKTELIEFVRDKRGHRVGCVAAVKDVESGKVTIGWSKCMTKPSSYDKKELGVVPDTFDKQWAIDKAIGRALSNDMFITLADASGINQSTARNILGHEVPSIVRPTIRKMAQRAKRYFKC